MHRFRRVVDRLPCAYPDFATTAPDWWRRAVAKILRAVHLRSRLTLGRPPLPHETSSRVLAPSPSAATLRPDGPVRANVDGRFDLRLHRASPTQGQPLPG